MKKFLFVCLIIIFNVSSVIAADWSKPVLSDTYTNVLGYINSKLSDAAKQLNSNTVTVTNPITGMIRWNSTNNNWDTYNGSTWVVLSSLYAINISGNAATATSATTATSSSNSDTIDFFHASQTPGANQAMVLSADGDVNIGPTSKIVLSKDSNTVQFGAGSRTTTIVNASGVVFLIVNGYLSNGVYKYITTGTAALQRVDGTNITYWQAVSGTADATITWNGPYTVWHSGNDGVGSGLDADLVQGVNLFNSPSSRIAWGAKPGFRGVMVLLTTSMTIPSYTASTSVGTTSWTTESYDTDNAHSVSTNTHQITVPAGIVLARFRAHSNWQVLAATGQRIAWIRKNGGAAVIQNSSPALDTSFGAQTSADTGVIVVAPGDVFSIDLFNQSSSSDTLYNGSWFSAEWIQ